MSREVEGLSRDAVGAAHLSWVLLGEGLPTAATAEPAGLRADREERVLVHQGFPGVGWARSLSRRPCGVVSFVASAKLSSAAAINNGAGVKRVAVRRSSIEL